jgi:hypothetical protein
MKFAFKKAENPNTSFFDELIGWWEDGKYSHVEAVLDYDKSTNLYFVASSVPGTGIRKAWISLPADTWDIVESPGDVKSVEAWFDARLGSEYDWLGILGFIFRPIKGNPTKRWFCSEAVLESLGMKEPWRFDPNACYDVLIERQRLVQLKSKHCSSPCY